MKNLIYPDICLICGTFFSITKKPLNYIPTYARFEDLFVNFLCQKCLKNYSKIDKPYCKKCGRPVIAGKNNELICGACQEVPPYFSKHRSCFLFKDSIVDIVHMLKYNKKLFLSKKISYFMLDLYLSLYLEEIPDYIIPVPMHKSKLRKRGYNQTYLIAKEMLFLAKKSGIFFPEFKYNIITKVKDTKSQTGLGALERKNNLKKAFCLENRSLAKRKKILLIDDVITTGTTLDEISRLFYRAGAKSVDALTFARVL